MPFDEQSVSRALHAVLNVLRGAICSTHTLTSTGDGLTFFTCLQTVERLRPVDHLEQVIFDVIVSHAYAAEKAGPGAFDECIRSILQHTKTLSKVADLNVQLNILCDTVGHGVHPGKTSDIQWLLAKHHLPYGLAELVREAVSLAGFAGRINVEKTETSVSSVELTHGYTFKLRPAFDVVTCLKHPRVFCIDGFVETVAEVHHLLQAASEAKEKCILFVRGLSEDVKSTLKINFDRGMLHVVPAIVQFDLEGINTLNDIAVVSGTDVVSTNKGQLISALKLTDVPVVDEVSVYNTQIVIKNVSTKPAVAAQLNALRTKRAQQNEDVACLLDTRIKSLLANHVTIRLPADRDFVYRAQTIDYVLRSIRALIDHGTVDIAGERVLTSTAYFSKLYTQRCVNVLSSLGAVVV